MVDLLCQHKTLNEILLTTVEKGVPELIPNTSMQILPTSYISLKQVKPLIPEKTLQLQIKDGVIYINNIEVINKKAISCFNIFQILLEQFLSDFAMGLAPEQHTLLSINKLEKRLKLEVTDLEQQIRKPLNKMQRTIKDKLASKLGLNSERNDVIQTLGRPGPLRKEYGYRLNPFTLILKKKIELQNCNISIPSREIL